MNNLHQKTDRFLSEIFVAADAFFTVKKIFYLLLAFILVHSTVSLFFNNQIFRDVAGVYAWYAREFGQYGVWWDIPASKVPQLNIFLAGLLVRCGIEAYSSVILLSLLFFALSMLPLYKMLKLFYSPKIAAYGCAIYVLAPRILRFSGTGLLETTRDFFLLSACYLLFKSWNNQCRWYHWVVLGLSLGGLALARGEGSVMAAIVAAGLLKRPAADYKSAKAFLQKIAVPIVVSVVVAFMISLPVIVKNYKVTGYPVIDARMIGVVELLPFIPRNTSSVEELPSKDARLLPHATFPVLQNDPLARLDGLLEKFLRGANELYFALAVIGMIFLVRQKKWRPEYSFFIIFTILICVFLVFVSVAHRYFIFVIPFFMVFTLKGIRSLLNMLKKYHLANILLAALVIVMVLQPLNAWCWMVKKDHDESIIKRYIQENRSIFLPEGENRKLLIHCNDNRIIFRSGEARLFHYGESRPGAQFITGFDVLLVNKKNKQELAGCVARKDLRAIKSPLRNFVVFVPVRSGK